MTIYLGFECYVHLILPFASSATTTTTTNKYLCNGQQNALHNFSCTLYGCNSMSILFTIYITEVDIVKGDQDAAENSDDECNNDKPGPLHKCK